MIFTETALAGAYIIEPERIADERGYFARTWCRREFEGRGLEGIWAQSSLSYNKAAGTVRGMHYQAAPYEETKLIRCTRGAVHDVIIDLRPHSPTFCLHIAVVLTVDNHRMLYVPAGFAHGFQTLEDDTEVTYLISEFHRPEFGRGVRWDDPAFNIQWPRPVSVITPRDRSYPDLSPELVARGSRP
jgi:dTDP-4-dehydrorhamnose 3,5-epimerase